MSRQCSHAVIAALVVAFAGAALDQPAGPPAARTAIAVAPEVLAGYVGSYRISDAVSLAVTQEGNHLFGALTGRPKHELFAQTSTRFYVTDVDTQVIFEPGPDGRGDSLALTVGGEPVEAPRIPDAVPRAP